MQNNQKINKAFSAIIFLTLLMALFAGSTILAAEDNKQKGSSAGEEEISVSEENQTKKVGKAPANFISTEEVPADQAVAFPTDI